MSSFKKSSQLKECFYHKKDECKGDIKQSHSIQRNGRLSIIEGMVNGNQSIYSLTSFVPSPEHMVEDLKPIGKKEASTFFGFCDYHDTTLFSPVENFKFDNSYKHLFLHSYRSFAHSYHRKKEDDRVYNDSNSLFVQKMPHEWLNTMRAGVAMALNDINPRKVYLERCIENEFYDELEYLVYEKRGLFPFAVSSIMSPEFSYRGKSMNNHENPNIPYSYPMITFLPDINSTFVVLAAFPDDKPAINLLNELDELPDLKLEKAITSLVITNCENTFFSPLFWNSLSVNDKRRFLNEVEGKNGNGTRKNDGFFHSSFNFFDSRFENSVLSNSFSAIKA